MMFPEKMHIRRVEDKGYIYVEAKIANPLNPKKAEKVEFLVDTGSRVCSISAELAEKLGLEPEGTADVELADGSSKRVKVAYVLLDIAGKKFYTWTIFDKGFTPILGMSVMESLGFHLDTPKKKVLMPIKSVRIKRIRLYVGLKPL
jgi:predicted aspartyl protease